MYRDKCAICGRELLAPGEKKYLSANQIRMVAPDFRGKFIYGGEVGSFVCRSKKKCLRRLVASGRVG